jgi:flagellar basal body P-ring formation protein FlgA
MTAPLVAMTRKYVQLRRLTRASLVGILTVTAGALTAVARADDVVDLRWQPPATIAEAARAAAARSGTGDVEAVAVDARLKMNRCATPLDAKVERAITRGTGTVVVSCSAPAWRLFVPVRATNDVDAVVLARNVQPGDVLTAADVSVARRSSAALPYDYLSDAAQAVGLTMRRTQPAGAVITAAALEAPEVVRRGELVTVTSGAGAISVKAEGVALAPARLNARVKVRTSSGRVIEGTAVGLGQVRVGS